MFKTRSVPEPCQPPITDGLYFVETAVRPMSYTRVMPIARPSMKPCIDCGVLVRGASRCSVHQLQTNRRIEKARGTRQDRGYGAEWMRLRARALRAQPWCGDCMTEGRPDNPLTGDHIVPLSAGGRNEPGNIRILCRRCNSVRGGMRATE